MARAAAILPAFALLACGPPSEAPTEPVDAGSEARDAGVDAGSTTAPTLPALPEDPALPILTPCPDGFDTVVLSSGVEVCEPWPPSGRAPCVVARAHHVGEEGCVDVGGPCPPGDFADDLPTSGAIIYVQAGAPSGGTGTRVAPFATIAEASAAADPESVIALARGLYEETLELRGEVSLWGACAAETRIVGPPDATSPTVRVTGVGNLVRRVHVSGPQIGIEAAGSDTGLTLLGVVVSEAIGGGIVARDGAAIAVHDARVSGIRAAAVPSPSGHGVRAESGGDIVAARLVIDDAESAGAYAHGAGTTLSLSNASVFDARPRTSDGTGGQGVLALAGASLTLRSAVIEGNGQAGIEARGVGTRLEAVDCVSRRHTGDASAYGGFGAWVGSGATLRLERCLVEESAGNGIEAQDGGTRLELADVVVRRTRGQPRDGSFGRGVDAYSGSTVHIRRALLAENVDYGLGCFNAGTSIDAENVTVTGTRSNGLEGSRGAGLFLMCGGALRKVRIYDNQELGIDASGPDAVLTLEDVAVTDTVPSPADTWGYGMQVLLGASVEMTRFLSDRNVTFGLYVESEGTSARVADSTIRDTLPQVSDGWWGRGIHVQTFGRATLSRALIERSRETGIFADHAVLALEDVTIRDTLPREAETFGGRALNLQSSTTVTGRRIVCEGSHEIAVALFGSEEWGGVRLSAEDVVVADTEPGCGAAECSGVGLGVYGFQAVASLTRFDLSGSALAGAQIARGGEVDLSRGAVHHNLIGVNVQTDGFDLSRVQQDVLYYANGGNLQSRDLPVPSAF